MDQNTERQLEGIEVDKTFTDKASGKDTQRPQLEALMSFVRSGDTVVVHSMDRLARNLDDLRRIVQTLTARPTFRTPSRPFAQLWASLAIPASITVCNNHRKIFIGRPALGTCGTMTAILGHSAENRSYL
jgi:hypothetical protein